MSRTKGARNKNSTEPSYFHMSVDERINLLANIVVDKILEDQGNGQQLLKQIEDDEQCKMG
jgi:N-acetylglutamate synthase-like GNAT family acetyltransferase